MSWRGFYNMKICLISVNKFEFHLNYMLGGIYRWFCIIIIYLEFHAIFYNNGILKIVFTLKNNCNFKFFDIYFQTYYGLLEKKNLILYIILWLYIYYENGHNKDVRFIVQIYLQHDEEM